MIQAITMWEEDPRWQEATYRFLLWSVAAIGVLALFSSAVTGDWIFVRSYLLGIAILVGALSIYAGFVWIIANSVAFLVRLCRGTRLE